MDSSDPGIKYDTPEWTSEAGGINYYQRSRHSTLDRGSSLSYAFDGVAIWYDYLSMPYNDQLVP